MIKENDIINVVGVDYNSHGIGVAKYAGKTIFVTNLIIGEKAEIKITKVKRSFALGKVVRFLEMSPDRIKPIIPETIHLGGCQFTQLTYAKELAHKKDKIERALRVIGGHNLTVKQIIPAEKIYFYRNKTVLPLGETKSGKIISGLYRHRTHEIIAMNQTHLDHENTGKIIEVIKQLITDFNYSVYDEKKHEGVFRKIMIRTSFTTGDVLLILITNATKIERIAEFSRELKDKLPELTGIVQNINTERTNVILGKNDVLLYGRDYVEEVINGITFRVSSKSFFQVNTAQAEILYNRALELANLSKNDVILDAYSGTGTLALLAAEKVKKAIGVEIVAEAVSDARKNAQRNNIKNAVFYAQDVNEFMNKSLIVEQVDVIIVDPPRKGLNLSFVNSILENPVKKIIYISCNPATLARDLAVLSEKYAVKVVEAVDMFPRTAHVETIVILKLKEKQHQNS
ncbi:MAG TPA: 23S rRNA (uracil(1939)-C(5))-methyltransferase RlmD [Bacilli bacterium]|nr:23S rRNA (uracil(1939)-C(5))-methyltransferase RlmD [Bacilli bacterium]